MFTRLLNQVATIERRNPSGFDVYGNETVTYAGSGDEQVDVPCWIHEQTSGEDTDDRETTTIRATGYFLATADIESYDRVSVGARVWEVKGPPRVLRDRTGAHHIEVDLEEVTP